MLEQLKHVSTSMRIKKDGRKEKNHSDTRGGGARERNYTVTMVKWQRRINEWKEDRKNINIPYTESEMYTKDNRSKGENENAKGVK